MAQKKGIEYYGQLMRHQFAKAVRTGGAVAIVLGAGIGGGIGIVSQDANEEVDTVGTAQRDAVFADLLSRGEYLTTGLQKYKAQQDVFEQSKGVDKKDVSVAFAALQLQAQEDLVPELKEYMADLYLTGDAEGIAVSEEDYRFFVSQIRDSMDREDWPVLLGKANWNNNFEAVHRYNRDNAEYLDTCYREHKTDSESATLRFQASSDIASCMSEQDNRLLLMVSMLLSGVLGAAGVGLLQSNRRIRKWADNKPTPPPSH